MKFKTILILIGIFFFKTSEGQNYDDHNFNHLQPDHRYFTSFFIEFNSAVNQKFFKGIEVPGLVRYVVTPSFSSVYLLDVVPIEISINKILKAELYYKAYDPEKKNRFIKIRKPIDPESAMVLVKLIRKALDQARYIPSNKLSINRLSTGRSTRYLFMDHMLSLRVASCQYYCFGLISIMDSIIQALLSDEASISFDDDLMRRIDLVMKRFNTLTNKSN